MLPPYSFLVIDSGVGISVYGKTGEIQIHLPNTNDLQNWFGKRRRLFTGEIRFKKIPHQVFNLKQGGDIRIFDRSDMSHTRPFKIENIFVTHRISEKISPSIFLPWLLNEEALLEQLSFVTGPGELCQHRAIINALFKVALMSDSFTVPFNQVFAWAPITPMMFTTPKAMYPWLEDLFEAKLVTQDSANTLTITGPLIYLMMQAINRRKIMSGPIFSY